MAELPYLPLKVESLITDTSHMTCAELGGYVRILCALWARGGLLPHDDKQLRRVAGVTPRQWGRIKPAIFDKLIIAEGMISQKRLTETRLRVQEIRRKRATASFKRWGKIDQKSTLYGQLIDFHKPLK